MASFILEYGYGVVIMFGAWFIGCSTFSSDKWCLYSLADVLPVNNPIHREWILTIVSEAIQDHQQSCHSLVVGTDFVLYVQFSIEKYMMQQ